VLGAVFGEHMPALGSREEAPITARPATARCVAELAGVSRASVSLVLSGQATRLGLSAATQERVRAAAKTLDYTPNQAARALRRRRSNIITFITADLGNRYVAEVVSAGEEAARARGYTVNLVAARTEAAEAHAIARLRSGASDGLVMHGDSDRLADELRRLEARGIACVLLQDPVADGSLPCVRADIEHGGFLATRHLLSLGHRRVAHISDERMLARPVNDRLRGYRRALAGAGIAFDPSLVIAGANSFAGGAAAMRSLVAHPGPRPTAVFVFNDQMAIGGLHALASQGLRVPHDMALVGFDGTDLGAFTTPELSTIDHPRHELGRLAATIVLDRLEGRASPPPTPPLPVRLIVRQSCGGSPA
jgi:LacI family repressor for deo operon, udp, cdd, tsx, nupC, and nupG